LGKLEGDIWSVRKIEILRTAAVPMSLALEKGFVAIVLLITGKIENFRDVFSHRKLSEPMIGHLNVL
jgi:hypothetical protein